MSRVVPDRVLERMKTLGFSQRSLAKEIGVEQPTVNRLLAGEVKNPRNLHVIAKALRTSIEYLTAESDDPEPEAVSDHRRAFRGMPATTDDPLAAAGLMGLKEIDLSLGAGGAYLDDGAISETVRYFPAAWVREFTDAPADQLVWARVRGTSMKPTIDDRAIVLIDLRRRRIDEQDEIWAIAIAEIGMVKRIWANPDGSYKIKSDNDRVTPETAHDDEMFVLGRVVGGFSRY